MVSDEKRKDIKSTVSVISVLLFPLSGLFYLDLIVQFFVRVQGRSVDDLSVVSLLSHTRSTLSFPVICLVCFDLVFEV